MSKILKHLDRNIEIYIASVLLIIFSILTIVQVIMRYVFNSPLSWSEELARFAFVWFVYISGSYAVKFQRHVKLSFVVNMLARPLKLSIQLLALLFWLAFLVFLDVYSIKTVKLIFANGTSSPANGVPMYVMYLSITIGAMLMTIRVVQHVIEKIKEMKGELQSS